VGKRLRPPPETLHEPVVEVTPVTIRTREPVA
jgi:hypothetical protein